MAARTAPAPLPELRSLDDDTLAARMAERQAELREMRLMLIERGKLTPRASAGSRHLSTHDLRAVKLYTAVCKHEMNAQRAQRDAAIALEAFNAHKAETGNEYAQLADRFRRIRERYDADKPRQRRPRKPKAVAVPQSE